MLTEYGRWPEAAWTSGSIDWKKANKITAGVDIGTTSSQAAIFCDGEIFSYCSIHTGSDIKRTSDIVFSKAAGSTGLTPSDMSAVAATGFGSRNVHYAAKILDDIQCHGKGARFMFGSEVKTVIDLGGQTVKAIALYGWDRIRDFEINDKCATGFGRNIETMCELMQVPIEEIGEKSLDVIKDPEPVSTTCYNFAVPEVIGLLRQGFKENDYSENEVLASYLFTIVWRSLGTIGKLAPLDIGDIELEQQVAFTGGLAKNIGITKRLERELRISAMCCPYDPQLAGAFGAALLA